MENNKETKKRKDEYRKKIPKWLVFDENKLDYKTINALIKFIGIIGLILLIILFFQMIGSLVLAPILQFLSIMTPFIAGFVVAWLLNPVVSKIQERWRFSRNRSSMIVTIVGFLGITLMFAGIVYFAFNALISFLTGTPLATLIDSGTSISEAIESNLNATKTESTMKLFITFSELAGFITLVGSSYVLTNLEFLNIPNSVPEIAKFLYSYLVAAVVIGFILPDFPGINNVFKSIIPKRYKKGGETLIDIIGKSFSDYMRGALSIALILGSFIGVGIGIIALLANTLLQSSDMGTGILMAEASTRVGVFFVIIVFALFSGVTNLIPYAGPFIGGIPIVLLVFLSDNSPGYWVTLAVAGIIVLVQSLESLFLQPTVMGKATRIHPVVILMGLALFGTLFGVVGLLISTPILAIGRGLINHYNEEYDLF